MDKRPEPKMAIRADRDFGEQSAALRQRFGDDLVDFVEQHYVQICELLDNNEWVEGLGGAYGWAPNLVSRAELPTGRQMERLIGAVERLTARPSYSPGT